jgi:hypothetical protein
MPYTHREVGDKDCVYKKGSEKKVGCTTGDVNDYLGALHANVKTEELEELNESLIAVGRDKMYAAIVNIKDSIKDNVVNTSDAVKTIVKSIKTGQELTKEQKTKIGDDLKKLLKSLGYGAVFMLPGGSVFIITFNLIKKIMDKKKLNESNKLKGGKADKLTPKEIADKFDVTTKMVKDQIKKGKKIESEHTSDEEKQTEIAEDHVSEFPDYYDRIEKMEKEAKKYWGKKTNETKSFIKKLLRENLQPNEPKNLDNELMKAGVPADMVDDVPVKLIYPNGEEKLLNPNLEEGAREFVFACLIAASGLVQSCAKEGDVHGYNTNVHGIEYTVVDAADENTVLTPEEEQQGIKLITVTANNGQTKTVKAKLFKDQQGNASGGWAFKEKPSEIELAIHGFGQTKKEEMRSNASFNKGDKIADYTVAKSSKQPYGVSPLKTIRDSEYFKNAINYIKQGPIQQQDFNKEMQEKGIGITAQDAIKYYGN